MTTQNGPDLGWVPFYEEFANRLRKDYGHDTRQGELVQAVREALAAVKSDASVNEGATCPFSVMASFNRGVSTSNETRKKISIALRHSLSVGADSPSKFDGIPVVNSQQWRFFPYTSEPEPGDIESLWKVFRDALALDKNPDDDGAKAAFADSFNVALGVKNNGLKKLTMGLFWIRPNTFVALDEPNLLYMERHFPHPLVGKANKASQSGNKRGFTGDNYLELNDYILRNLEEAKEAGSRVASIPSLSHAAWVSRNRDFVQTAVAQLFEDLSEFDPAIVEDELERKLSSIVPRPGQNKFREKLLKAYGEHCAITGYDAEKALQAAHIRPYKGRKTDRVDNGLLLRADIHNLFDAYLLGIDPDTGDVWISNELKDTKYAELEGKKAQVPEKPAHRPKADALRERWEKARELGRFN